MQRDKVLASLKENLARTQQRMKYFADSRRSDVQFQVGDWVWVRLRPYRQNTLRRHLMNKLSRRYYGPFQVESRIGSVSYRLTLPLESKVHPVFHVSTLKRFQGDPVQMQAALPPTDVDGRFSLQPAAVVNTRSIRRQRKVIRQCLVQWVALPPSEATWEDVGVLEREFPGLNLEDKVLLPENEDNVMKVTKTTQERVKKAPTYLKDYVTN